MNESDGLQSFPVTALHVQLENQANTSFILIFENN